MSLRTRPATIDAWIRADHEMDAAALRALLSPGRSGEPLQELILLQLGADELVEQVTLIGRPLPGVLGIMKGIGGGLVRRGVMSRASGGIAPIAAVIGLVERHVTPWIAPRP